MDGSPNGPTNGPTNGSINHDTPAEPAPSFDADIFRSYLVSLLPPVIGAFPSELDSLFGEEFEEHVARFASESGSSLYIVKVKHESEGVFAIFSFLAHAN